MTLKELREILIKDMLMKDAEKRILFEDSLETDDGDLIIRMVTKYAIGINCHEYIYIKSTDRIIRNNASLPDEAVEVIKNYRNL